MPTRNFGVPSEPVYVTNLDLGGGMNTLKVPHLLNRSQLPYLSNYWYSAQNAISKRAGNTYFGTANGATGAGVAGKGVVTCVFGGVTYVITQQGNTLYSCPVGGTSYTNIGTVGGGTIRGAQMYDPTNPTASTANGTVFIVNGVDVPWVWIGPGNSISPAAGTLPTNFSGGSTFTPKYVTTAGNNSLLVYSGEPTFPGAVFISNPFYPSVFSSNTSTTTAYGGSYIPYIVGQNDGVNGGDITGVEALGSMLIVYKQAAIYRMYQIGLYGDLVWKSEVVSPSVGCVAPRSIARFDTFHCFLGFDGVYQTDGQSTRCISASVPTYFDGSLTGGNPQITTRSTAIGVRHGNRYLLFFENQSLGYPTKGLAFDFSKTDENGLPVVSEINGMAPNGMAPLRGPNDTGNVIWTDAVLDRVGQFGVGYSDFGSAITTQFTTKADFFADELGPDALTWTKKLQNLTLAVSIPQQQSSITLTFQVQVVTDLLNFTTQSANPISVGPASSGSWGSNWGTMVWTSSSGSAQYGTTKVQAQDAAQGHVLQLVITEASTYPYTILGYTEELNFQLEAA